MALPVARAFNPCERPDQRTDLNRAPNPSDNPDAMHPTHSDFGRRLFTKTGSVGGGSGWLVVAVLLLAFAAFILWETRATRHWSDYRSPAGVAQWAVTGIAFFSVGLAVRGLRRGRFSRHLFEEGTCYEGGGHRQWLAYRDVETVSYSVRSAGGRTERSLAFAGAGGQPRVRLRTELREDEAGDDATPGVAEIDNVSARVVKAVAARMIERVDRGEVVNWTGALWIDPAGVRIGGQADGNFVPWTAIDGVKDGGQNGRIEIYAFGQSVASAATSDANALPGLQAFMLLLDRGQAAARSTEPVGAGAAAEATTWDPGDREPRLRPR